MMIGWNWPAYGTLMPSVLGYCATMLKFHILGREPWPQKWAGHSIIRKWWLPPREIVLVHLCHCHKIVETGKSTKNRNVFLTAFGLRFGVEGAKGTILLQHFSPWH
jgi:hypothetical protein